MVRKLCVGLGVIVMVGATDVDAKVNLKAAGDRQAYALGYSIAKGLNERDKELSPEALLQGMKDGFKGKGELSDADIQTAMVNYQDAVRLKQVEANKKALLENEAKGKTFLVNNSKQPGVITLPSGLQYKVLRSGEGTASPKPTDTVSVNYRGTLINGTEFDSSYSRGEATSFPVNRVIAGWTEALQLMVVGDKWKLFIPADLAYGAQGAGNLIGPNETLIFEVELLSIK